MHFTLSFLISVEISGFYTNAIRLTYDEKGESRKDSKPHASKRYRRIKTKVFFSQISTQILMIVKHSKESEKKH